MAIIPALIFLIVLILMAAGLIILQIRLSQTDGKWPGIILPALTFLLALSIALGTTLFTTNLHTQTEILSEDNSVSQVVEIYSYKDEVSPAANNFPALFFYPFLYLFIICNIPTIIFLAIYIAIRNKTKRKKQLEKMQIQDL